MPSGPIRPAGVHPPIALGLSSPRHAVLRPAPEAPSPEDQFEPRRLAVTSSHADLNADGSVVVLGERAQPRATLSMDEIRAAPTGRREELGQRLAGVLTLWAGTRLGTLAADPLPSGTATRGRWFAHADPAAITFGAEDGRRVVIERRDGRVHLSGAGFGTAPSLQQARELALEAFSQLLGGAQSADELDPTAAALFLAVMGPAGVLAADVTEPSTPNQRFRSPKLIAWDFNDTLQDDDGRFRPGLSDAVTALNRMGAVSVLTTSISPEGPEEVLRAEAVPFVGFFGNAEVRPTRGEKRYEGVAHEHGLTNVRSQHQMVVIGDSATDLPGDGAAGLFINDKVMVPASAIELLLHQLDERGDGSLIHGLDHALGGELAAGEMRKVAVGPLELTVSARQTPAGRTVRVINEISISLSNDELAARLGAAGAGATGSTERLAREHLSWSLQEERIPEVLTQVRNLGRDPSAAIEATERRLQLWSEDATWARAVGARLEEVVAQPLQFRQIVNLAHRMANAADPEAAEAILRVARTFRPLNDSAEQVLGAGLERYGAEVGLHEAANDPAQWQLSSGEARAKAIRILHRALQSPVPLAPDRQAVLLQALEHTRDDARPEVRELRKAFVRSVEEAMPGARVELSSVFAERRARADELEAVGLRALELSQRRKVTVAEIQNALSADV